MGKRKQRQGDSLADVLRESFALPQVLDAVQPLVHINCRGSIQLENCDRILEYSPACIRLQMLNNVVAIEGDDLTILSLNAHITEVHGKIFRLSFSGDGV